jgi:hypothetical protein
MNLLILSGIDPTEYGYRELSDADSIDLLRLARLAKEAVGKLADHDLAVAIDVVLDDLAPALRALAAGVAI